MAIDRMRIKAALGLMPERIRAKIMKQLAIALREAKKPWTVETRPMMARVETARPKRGER